MTASEESQRVRIEIAKAIYKRNPAKQPWDGDGYGWHEAGAGYYKKLAYRQADSVMEVLGLPNLTSHETD